MGLVCAAHWNGEAFEVEGDWSGTVVNPILCVPGDHAARTQLYLSPRDLHVAAEFIGGRGGSWKADLLGSIQGPGVTLRSWEAAYDVQGDDPAAALDQIQNAAASLRRSGLEKVTSTSAAAFELFLKWSKVQRFDADVRVPPGRWHAPPRPTVFYSTESRWVRLLGERGVEIRPVDHPVRYVDLSDAYVAGMRAPLPVGAPEHEVFENGGGPLDLRKLKGHGMSLMSGAADGGIVCNAKGEPLSLGEPFDRVWLSDLELAAMQSRGGEIWAVHERMSQPSLGFPLDRFVAWALRVRDGQKALKGIARKAFGVLAMGKWGRVVKREWTPGFRPVLAFGRYMGGWAERGRPSPNPIAARWIYARTLIRVVEEEDAIRRAGGRVVYGDTDGIMFSGSFNCHSDFKSKGEGNFLALGQKRYAFEAVDGSISATVCGINPLDAAAALRSGQGLVRNGAGEVSALIIGRTVEGP